MIDYARVSEISSSKTRKNTQQMPRNCHPTVPSLNNNNNSDVLLPLRLHKKTCSRRWTFCSTKAIVIMTKTNEHTHIERKGTKSTIVQWYFSVVQHNFFRKWADEKTHQRMINIQICNHNSIGRFHLYIFEENESNDMQCWCYVNWRVFLLFISILRIS